MRIGSHLQLGEKAALRRDSILWKMQKGIYQKDVFVMTLAENPRNLLELYPASALIQPYFLQSDLLVVGLAQGKKEADELLRATIEKIYRETGALDVRAYFGDSEET